MYVCNNFTKLNYADIIMYRGSFDLTRLVDKRRATVTARVLISWMEYWVG